MVRKYIIAAVTVVLTVALTYCIYRGGKAYSHRNGSDFTDNGQVTSTKQSRGPTNEMQVSNKPENMPMRIYNYLIPRITTKKDYILKFGKFGLKPPKESIDEQKKSEGGVVMQRPVNPHGEWHWGVSEIVFSAMSFAMLVFTSFFG